MGTMIVRLTDRDGFESLDAFNDDCWPMADAMVDWLTNGITMEVLAYYPTIEAQRTEGGRFLYERCCANMQRALNKEYDICSSE